MSQKARLIELQKQVRISKTALTAISNGCRNHETVATEALDALWALDKKQPLQGVVGHQTEAAMSYQVRKNGEI